MKIYKLLSIIFFLIIYTTQYTYGEGCNYNSQISECIEANKSGTEKSITDFICITGAYETIVHQIVLDDKFKEVDEEMDKYIFDLEKNKSTYFGNGSQLNYFDGVNHIENKKQYFNKKYRDLCGNPIHKEVILCTGDMNVYIDTKGDNTISTYETRKTFNNGLCSNLADIKLEIFDDVSFGILMLNKLQVKADEKKTYDQGQNKNYNMLIDIMMVNLGYLERIWQKWPSKIAQPH